MNRIYILLCVCALLTTIGCGSSKPQQEVDVWSRTNYEVTCDRVGTEGVQTMVVASFGRDVSDALAQARWSAIHALLFKGVHTNVCNAPALVNYQDYVTHESWFKSFFSSSGGYLDHIVVAGDVPLDMVYVGRSVKVYSNVAVNRNGLRSELVNAGIIKDMGTVFERSTDD
jgi:hypothetical protein